MRIRLNVNEPGVVSVKLAGRGKMSKTKTRRTTGGRVLINVRALTSGLRPGKLTLTLGAKDAARNASTKQLSVRR